MSRARLPVLSIRGVILLICCLPAVLAGVGMIGLWVSFADRTRNEYNELLSRTTSRTIARDAQILNNDVSRMVGHLGRLFSNHYRREEMPVPGQNPGASKLVQIIYVAAMANDSYRNVGFCTENALVQLHYDPADGAPCLYYGLRSEDGSVAAYWYRFGAGGWALVRQEAAGELPLQQRDFFRVAQQNSGRLIVSRPFRDPGVNWFHTYYAQSFLAPGGVWGVVFGSVSLQDFFSIYLFSANSGSEGSFLICNRQGQLLGYQKMDRLLMGSGQSQPPLVRDIAGPAVGPEMLALQQAIRKGGTRLLQDAGPHPAAPVAGAGDRPGANVQFFPVPDAVLQCRELPPAETESVQIDRPGRDSTVYLTSIPNTDWLLVSIYDDEELGDFLYAEGKHIFTEYGVILLASCLFFVWLARRRISDPVQALVRRLDFVRALIFLPRESAGGIREINDLRNGVDRLEESLQSFAKFIPCDIVRDRIAAGGAVQPGCATEYAAVVLLRAHNFSAEISRNEAFITLYAHYLEKMTGLADSCGGGSLFFEADLVAFWKEDERPGAQKACRFLELAQKELERLNSDWRQQEAPELDVTMVAHAGEFLFGNLGTPERLAYTILGGNLQMLYEQARLTVRNGARMLASRPLLLHFRDRVLSRPCMEVEGRGGFLVFEEILKFGRGGEIYDPAARLAGRFTSVWNLLGRMEYEEALARLAALQSEFPQDRLTAYYLETVRELIRTSPGPNARLIQGMDVDGAGSGETGTSGG